MTETSVAELLADLEEKVHRAAEEIQRLRRENGELARRVEELSVAEPEGGAGEAWREERREVRQRVERIAQHLTKLLEA